MNTEEASVKVGSAAATKDGSLAALLLCYAGMVMIAIAVNLPPVYLTTFAHEFGGAAGLGEAQLGWIGTLLFVGLTAGLLASSPFADRWGAKTFVLLGNGLVAAGLGLMAFAPTYPVLLVAAGLMGVGAGVLDMILSPIVAALYPHNRTSAMNWLHAFYAIGKILITLATSLAIGLSATYSIFGWRNVSLVLIVAPVVVLLGFVRIALPPLVAAEKKRTPALALLTSLPFVVAMVAMLLAGATELGMAQWLPAFAEKGLGYPAWAATQALTAFAVAMAAGRLAGGWIGRHIRPMRLLILCCAASAILYVVGALYPNRAVALSACIAIGLAISVLWPTVLGITADRFPYGGAMMFGLLAAAGNAGGVINLAIGSVADRYSLGWALAGVAVCPVIMLLLLVWLSRQQPKGQQAGFAVSAADGK